METRKTKLSLEKAGGTAGANTLKYRVSLPSSWVNAMGLGQHARDLDLIFENGEVRIRKRQSLSPDDFLRRAQRDRHKVKQYRYYNKDTLCSTIYADFTAKELIAINRTDELIHRAFGTNESPSWEDFMAFLSERSIPRTRHGIEHILKDMGLDEYDPVKITEKSQGRMFEDHQWLEISEV